MIHQYRSNGYNIVMDINSGAVHIVDDVVYDVLPLLEEKKREEGGGEKEKREEGGGKKRKEGERKGCIRGGGGGEQLTYIQG